MASIKYVIELSEEEKEQLKAIVSKGTESAQTILRANILLASDRNNKKHLTVVEMAEAFHCATGTIQKVCTSYANNGMEAAIRRKLRETPPRQPKVTGDVEAIALACGEPPEGYSRWTVRLISEKCVELGYVESLSHMTVQRLLKEKNLSLT